MFGPVGEALGASIPAKAEANVLPATKVQNKAADAAVQEVARETFDIVVDQSDTSQVTHFYQKLDKTPATVRATSDKTDETAKKSPPLLTAAEQALKTKSAEKQQKSETKKESAEEKRNLNKEVDELITQNGFKEVNGRLQGTFVGKEGKPETYQTGLTREGLKQVIKEARNVNNAAQIFRFHSADKTQVELLVIKSETGFTLLHRGQKIAEGAEGTVSHAWNITKGRLEILKESHNVPVSNKRVDTRSTPIYQEASNCHHLNPDGKARGIAKEPHLIFNLMRPSEKGTPAGQAGALFPRYDGDAEIIMGRESMAAFDTGQLLNGLKDLFQGADCIHRRERFDVDIRPKNVLARLERNDQGEVKKITLDHTDFGSVVRLDSVDRITGEESMPDINHDSICDSDFLRLRGLYVEIGATNAELKESGEKAAGIAKRISEIEKGLEKKPGDKKLIKEKATLEAMRADLISQQKILLGQRTKLHQSLNNLAADVHVWATANTAIQIVTGVTHTCGRTKVSVNVNSVNMEDKKAREAYVGKLIAKIKGDDKLTDPEKKARTACLEQLLGLIDPGVIVTPEKLPTRDNLMNIQRRYQAAAQVNFQKMIDDLQTAQSETGR